MNKRVNHTLNLLKLRSNCDILDILDTQGLLEKGNSVDERLVLLSPRGGLLHNPLVSHSGLVEPQRVSRFRMEGVDDAIALLGDLLARLVERAWHLGG